MSITAEIRVRATLAGDEPTRLVGSAKVASVDVKDENLSAHLQAPDFFDAERHPELKFESTGIELSQGAVTVPGELTIKGVTRPVELNGTVAEPLVDPYGRERIGLRLETAIDRTDFGVDWNNELPNGEPALGNEVSLAADLYFTKEA
jgi:polyisoprenoid-binding protein YceI